MTRFLKKKDNNFVGGKQTFNHCCIASLTLTLEGLAKTSLDA